MILNHHPRKINLTNGDEENGIGLKKKKKKKEEKKGQRATKQINATVCLGKPVMKFVFCQYFL